MKKSRKKNRTRNAENTVASALQSNSYESKQYIGNKNISLVISAYSFVNSNFHSSLNTLSSVILMTESAFAFTAIALNIINIFSSLMSIYALSLTLYIISVVSNFESKRAIVKYIREKTDDIDLIIDKIENAHKHNSFFIGTFVLFSFIFIILISDQISKYMTIKL